MPNPKTRGNKGVIHKILRETKSLVVQLTLLFFFVFQTKMFVGLSTCLHNTYLNNSNHKILGITIYRMSVESYIGCLLGWSWVYKWLRWVSNVICLVLLRYKCKCGLHFLWATKMVHLSLVFRFLYYLDLWFVSMLCVS